MSEVLNPEKLKYDKLWATQEYRTVAPGELFAQEFLKHADPDPDSEVIDFGCGTGRGALMLALFGRMKVTMLDFSENCLDPEVAEACVTQPTRIKFLAHDLTQPSPVKANFGYCCDVMEHIPPEDVKAVLKNITDATSHVFFGISTVDDVMGAMIGEPLHLTVKPFSWWLDQIQSLGAVVHWAAEAENACFFYVSMWKDAGEIVKTGRLNVTDEQLDTQTKENILSGWIQATPFERQDREVVLLAGGPSMKDQVSKIRELREEQNCVLVTVNGAYHWALEQNLKVSAQVVLDAREFNQRFVQPVVPDCRYLIASQVHPKTLQGLPRERTYLWHSGISEDNEALVKQLTGSYYPIPGGSTVVLRALPLLRMLGYWRIHVFGFDSCVMSSGEHHAYPQTENDGHQTMTITCGEREFECTPWMVSQASEFRDLVKFMGDEIELAVYGDGLISQIIATGASFSTKED